MNKPRELLLDTGCLIDIYHGRERIRPFFDDILNGMIRPHISVITEAELWRGLRAGEVQRHELLLNQFAILFLRSDVARLAGSWMQLYQASGLGWMDALIVATAKTARLPVLTRDKKLAAVLSAEVHFDVYG
jgi:predicted nucleic acid-binding protein